jgi:ParB-like chromosome segregation protein Spo0J
MHIDELKQHPRNTETFRDLTGEEFEELKASISDHGIIEPVIVNQDGIIICGHQRVRACRELGINDVPVVVREVVSDEEHETLLIEENLRRRQLLEERQKPAAKEIVIEKEIVEPPDYKKIKSENIDLEIKIRSLSDKIKKQREKFDKDRTTFEKSVTEKMATKIKLKEEHLDRLRKEIDEKYAQIEALDRSNGMVIPAKELARRIERDLEDIAAGLEEFFDDLGSYEIPEESLPRLRKLADRMLTGAENFSALLRKKEMITLEVER